MDTTTSTDAQVANADTSTTAQAAIATTDAQVADGNDSSTALSHEDARKLRSEAQNLRKRLKSYEDQENLAKEAALSEVDKASKRATDAEQKVKQYQQQLVTAQVKMAAQRIGIIDPELAALAVQSSLEFDDDGMPSNLDKVLSDLLKNKPFLAAAPTPAPTNSTKPPAVPAMNPGRTAIQSPGGQQPGRIPSWSDIYKR